MPSNNSNSELQDLYASLREDKTFLSKKPEVHDLLASLVKDGTLQDLSQPTPPPAAVLDDVPLSERVNAQAVRKVAPPTPPIDDEPLSDRTNRRAVRKVAPNLMDIRRPLTQAEAATLSPEQIAKRAGDTAHFYEKYGRYPWQAPARDNRTALQKVRDWAANPLNLSPEQIARGRAARQDVARGGNGQRLLNPISTAPQSQAAYSRAGNMVRNFVQGAIVPGLARASQAPGSTNVLANVGATLKQIADPRFLDQALTSANAAMLTDQGPQMVGRFAPGLEPGTLAGDTLNTLTALATNPANFLDAGAASRVDVGKVARTLGKRVQPYINTAKAAQGSMPLLDAEGNVLGYVKQPKPAAVKVAPSRIVVPDEAPVPRPAAKPAPTPSPYAMPVEPDEITGSAPRAQIEAVQPGVTPTPIPVRTGKAARPTRVGRAIPLGGTVPARVGPPHILPPPTQIESAVPMGQKALPPAPVVEPEPIPVPSPGVRQDAPLTVSTPDNEAVPFRYRVRELSELVPSHTEGFAPTPGYDQSLQPRDRTRAATREQIEEMARNLNPQRLLDSPTTADGAPVIGADLQVESGNGRTMALRQAARQYPQKFQQYKAALSEWAQAHPESGLDAAQIAGMQQPVLVREREGELPPEQRAQLAARMGKSTIAEMSPTETAQADAKNLLSDAVLPLFTPAHDGSVSGAANRDFVRAFAGTLTPGERANFINAHGALSPQGQDRVQRALMAAAYRDDGLLHRLFEGGVDDVKNVATALRTTSGRMATLRHKVAQGNLAAHADIGEDIAQAANTFASIVKSKPEGLKTGQAVKAHLAQVGMFDEGISPIAQEILSFMGEHNLSQKNLTAYLNAYADAAEDMARVGQSALFGNREQTASTLLEVARQRTLKETARDATPDLFAADPAPTATTTPATKPARVAVQTAPAQPGPRAEITRPAPAPAASGEGVPSRPAKAQASDVEPKKRGRKEEDRTVTVRERQQAAQDEVRTRGPLSDEDKAAYEKYVAARKREERGLPLLKAHKEVLAQAEGENAPARWMMSRYAVQYGGKVVKTLAAPRRGRTGISVQKATPAPPPGPSGTSTPAPTPAVAPPTPTGPVYPRIDVAPLPLARDAQGKPLPLPSKAKTVADLEKGIGFAIRRGRRLGARVGGSYNTGTGRVATAGTFDLDTIAHETMHGLQDRHGVLRDYRNNANSPFDGELVPQFSSHGSQPPAGLSPLDAAVYEREEGAAEWLRAWIVNPDEAIAKAPKFAAHFEKTVPESVRTALSAYSEQVRRYASTDADASLARQGASTQYDAPESPKLIERIKAAFVQTDPDGRYRTPAHVLVAQKLRSDFAAVDALAGVAARERGIVRDPQVFKAEGGLDPSEEPRILAAELRYFDQKFADTLTHGLRDSQGNLLTGPYLDIYEPLTTQHPKGGADFEEELRDADSLALALRVEDEARRIDEKLAETLARDADRYQEWMLRYVEKAATGKAAQRIATQVAVARAKIIADARGRLRAQEATIRTRLETEIRLTENMTQVQRAAREARIARELGKEMRRIESQAWAKADADIRVASARIRNAAKLDTVKKRIALRTDKAIGRRLQKAALGSLDAQGRRVTQDTAQDARRVVRVDKKRTNADALIAKKSAASQGRVQKALAKVDAKGDARQQTNLSRAAATAAKIVAKRMAKRVASRTASAEQKKFGIVGWDSGVTGKSDQVQAQEIVQAIRAKGDAARWVRLETTTQNLNQYSEAILRYLVEAGRLAPENYQAAVQAHNFYAPLTRVAETLPGSNVPVRGGGLSRGRRVAETFSGSGKMVQQTGVSVMANLYKAVKEADRNRVLVALRNLLVDEQRGIYDGAAPYLDGLGTRVEPTRGPGGREIAPKDTVTVYVDGVPEYWQFGDEAVMQALSGLGKVQLPSVALAVPRFLRNLTQATATLTPQFAVWNKIRDMGGRSIKSNTGAMPFSVQDLADNFKLPDEWEKSLYDRHGAGLSSARILENPSDFYAIQDAILKEAGVRPRTLKDWLSWASEMLHKPLEISEQGTRVAEIRSARRYAESKGLPPGEVERYAAAQSRDLQDFTDAGEWTRPINRNFIPFLTASIEGNMRSLGAAYRAAKNPRFRMRYLGRMALLAGITTLAHWAYIRSRSKDRSDEYLEFPSWQRDFFWMVPVGDSGQWLAVPKPHEAAMASSFLDRGLAAAFSGDKSQLTDGMGGSAWKTLMPFDQGDLMGGAFSPLAEAYVNTDFFRGGQIVPSWEDSLDLDLRRGQVEATRASQIAGKVLGVDARKVEHVAEGFGGKWASTGLALTDIGRTDRQQPLGRVAKNMLGMVKDAPGTSSRSYQKAQEELRGAGVAAGAPVNELLQMAREKYRAREGADKAQAARDLRTLSRSPLVTATAQVARTKKRVVNDVASKVMDSPSLAKLPPDARAMVERLVRQRAQKAMRK